jgi:pyruvate dehydrogenase E1 component alpha subunit
MLRLRALEGRSTKGPRLEALKAATLMHLEAGDYTAAPGAEDALPAKSPKKTARKAPALAAKPTRDRIATAAGVAQGFKLAKLDRAAIVFTDTASAAISEPGWAEALDYAMRAELALIVVYIDSLATLAAPDTTGNNPVAPSWAAAEQLSARTKIPIVSVDGEDAVALYRVMQESMIHVRLGVGPILVWALCSGSKLKPSEEPIARLEDYMRVRDIPMAAVARKSR